MEPKKETIKQTDFTPKDISDHVKELVGLDGVTFKNLDEHVERFKREFGGD